jgi:hypothetical protein
VARQVSDALSYHYLSNKNIYGLREGGMNGTHDDDATIANIHMHPRHLVYAKYSDSFLWWAKTKTTIVANFDMLL